MVLMSIRMKRNRMGDQIMSKIIPKYLGVTFLISYALWGTIIVANLFGYLKFGTPVCMIFFLLGAFGPTVSSYIVQKQAGRVAGFKDFMKQTFRLKAPFLSYGLVLFYLLLYFIYPAISGKITLGLPIYISILMIPLMLFGGGMEEVGWRWVLQPELEKILPFGVATVTTSLIWTVWHLPLFFIQGSSQSYVNFWAFLILLIGFSFAQATLYSYSKNIWLSVLLHCSLNALPSSLVFKESIPTNTVISILMIVAALLVRNARKE